MRIGFGLTSRFHMLDLAREIRNLGDDTRVFTALPMVRVDRELRDCARTHPSRLMMWRAAGRVPLLKNLRIWENQTYKDFSRWLGRAVQGIELDVLDALDCIGLDAGRTVQRRGGVWVVTRCSSHILNQKELLTEEHARWKQPVPRTYFLPWIVERGLAEYEAADGIMVPSGFVKRSFVDRGIDPERVHLCPYGVDLSMFKPQPREDGRFRVIFAGAQSIRKGIGYLFEALRPLVKSGAVELWLVGPAVGESRDILRENADLFVHHGVQPRGKLSWYYSQASVLVLPSIEEGLAYVQAQAMACGTPVIGTTNSGAEDLFTDGVEGFIVPPRDPAAIRDRVQRLIDEPDLLARMRVASLQRVQSIGGWAQYGRMCRDVYSRLLDRRGSARRPLETGALS